MSSNINFNGYNINDDVIKRGTCYWDGGILSGASLREPLICNVREFRLVIN